MRTSLFIAMEAAWIAVLLLFVDAAIEGVADPRVLWIGTLYPAGLAVDWLLRRAVRQPRWLTALRVAALILPVLAAAWLARDIFSFGWSLDVWNTDWTDPAGRRAVALLVAGLACWLRGMLLCGRVPDTDAIAFGFQVGVITVLVVLGIAAALQIDVPGAAGLGLLLVSAGVLGLWHSRASRRTRGGVVGTRDPAAAAMGLAVVLLLGVGVAALLDRGVVDVLLAILKAIWDAFLYLLELLPDYTPTPAEPDEELFAAPSGGVPELGPTFGGEPSPWGRIVLTLLMCGLLAWFLFNNLRALLAWLKRTEHTPGLSFDRSSYGFGHTLALIWQRFIAWFTSIPQRLRHVFARRRELREDPAQRSWRWLAREMEQRGWPRKPAETPYEYAQRLQGIWPGRGTNLALLTRLFVRSRYDQPRFTTPRRWKRFLIRIRRATVRIPNAPEYSAWGASPAPSTSRTAPIHPGDPHDSSRSHSPPR